MNTIICLLKTQIQVLHKLLSVDQSDTKFIEKCVTY